MDQERLVEQSWNSYRESVMPRDAGVTQVIECRRAFFAGAQGLYGIVMTALDPGQEATEKDLRVMASIHAELARFVDQVKAGLR